MNKSKNKLSKVVNYSLALSLVGTGVGLTSLVTPTHTVLAAKNHDGVCQVETKNGELVFQANGTNVTTTKPVDLLLVVDSSGSVDSDKMSNFVHILRGLINSLADDSQIMLATYKENTADSYATTMTRMMTKAEALGVFDSILNDSRRFVEVYRQSTVWDAAKDYHATQQDLPFEDAFAKGLNPNHTHSILQVTDGWYGTETIDTTLVDWAKANAKTFMSVLIGGKPTSRSYTEMVKAGHPNIYYVPESAHVDLPKVTSDVIQQFNTTATERVSPTANIKVTPEEGITLKEVKLVSPDGKEEVLPIQGNKVNINKELAKDGNYKVKVKADGLVPENRKVVTTVNIANKEVGKSEILFEGCKDDVKGIDEERTRVNIDFKTKYVDDANLMTGTEKVVTDGVIGIKEIIKTWNTINGKRVGEPKIIENMLQGVIDKVIARGTKGFDREVIKQKIPFDTKYIDDEKLESGKTKVVTEGVEGEKEITKVYVTQSGKRVGEPTVTEKVVKPKVDKVIARGTQQPKDFTYRVLDKDGKVLVDTTKVAQGYIGNEYKLAEVPKLEGYEVVTPEGIKLDGVFNGENVNIDFVAYKLGDEVSLNLVDVKGKVLGKGQVLVEKGKRVGVDFSGKVEKEFKDGDRLYRLTELKLGDTKLEGLEFTGKVTEVAQKYVAQYKEVLPAPVKVNFVDENGKELQKPVNLLKEASRLDGEYTYTPEKRVKVGTDEYALVKVTLDGKEVKEIKGKFTEKEQVYKVEYKKVVKPAPAKLPKTSASDLRGYGIVATLLGVLGFLGFRRFK